MRRALSEWTTTSIASRFLLALLDEAGQPADEVFGRAGFGRDALSAPDFRLPLPVFRELWARAAALTPDIGLSMVERFPPGQRHLLAHLALGSATVRSALADTCRYAAATSRADHIRLEIDDQIARVSYQCTAPGPANPWMAEHYFSMAAVFLAQATGRALPISAVEFAGPARADAAAYRRRFGIDPRFDSGRNVLEFSAHALDWPLLSHDAYLHAILERVAHSLAQAQAARATPDDPLLNQVRREILARVIQRESPGIDEIATSCRLGVRALRDRLARERTTFRQLVDEARRELARDQLATGVSVTEASYALGFSEPAAFQHACRRWFGQSAGDLRRQLLGIANDGVSP